MAAKILKTVVVTAYFVFPVNLALADCHWDFPGDPGCEPYDQLHYNYYYYEEHSYSYYSYPYPYPYPYPGYGYPYPYPYPGYGYPYPYPYPGYGYPSPYPYPSYGYPYPYPSYGYPSPYPYPSYGYPYPYPTPIYPYPTPIYPYPTPPTIILNFTANPTTINPGETSTFFWSTSGASSCSISPSIGSVPLNCNPPDCPDSQDTVSPATTTVYTLMCAGPSGPTSDNVTINVGATPRFEEVPPQ